MSRPAHVLALALASGAALALTACGTSASSGDSSGAASGEKVQVVAAFYPLEYAAQRVGGDAVSVTNLTRAGVEPHDLELTPQDVATVSNARLAAYLKGFQPALDQAIADQAASTAYDVSADADLILTGAHDDHGTQTKDPHFWLDPIRYGKVVTALGARLGEVDAAHQADYATNAAAFVDELDALDQELSRGLANCANRTLVTSHAAFGYLGERYRLTEHAIGGLSPDQEPEAAKLAQIARYVKDHQITTIYAETLVSPAVAQTVARESGATTAVLDPIEGLSDASAGTNYGEIMRANLATLKKGQTCS